MQWIWGAIVSAGPTGKTQTCLPLDYRHPLPERNIEFSAEAPMIASKTARFFLQYAAGNPLGLLGMVGRRVVERFGRAPSGLAIIRVGDVKCEIDMSLHRLMRKYFFQTHEMYLERIFEKRLTSGQIFIDVGANCGYWSARALARVGRAGAVHAFEPVPQYFSILRRLEELNPEHKFVANNCACGAVVERFPMVIVPPRLDNFDNYNTNIGSSSLQPGFLDHDWELTETIEVDVIRLDRYLADHAIDLDRIGLIKVDVEGFELSVFDGMQNILTKTGTKIPILCEILTDPVRSHPLDGRKTIERLEDAGYRCLNATSLLPIDRSTLRFEENMLCV